MANESLIANPVTHMHVYAFLDSHIKPRTQNYMSIYNTTDHSLVYKLTKADQRISVTFVHSMLLQCLQYIQYETHQDVFKTEKLVLTTRTCSNSFLTVCGGRVCAGIWTRDHICYKYNAQIDSAGINEDLHHDQSC